MLAKILAGAPLGIDAYPVEVEVGAQGHPQSATKAPADNRKDGASSAARNTPTPRLV